MGSAGGNNVHSAIKDFMCRMREFRSLCDLVVCVCVLCPATEWILAEFVGLESTERIECDSMRNACNCELHRVQEAPTNRLEDAAYAFARSRISVPFC